MSAPVPGPSSGAPSTSKAMPDSNEDQILDHYDVILTGTDLTSILVGSAVARTGKSVLQIESEALYGQEWSPMSLRELMTAEVTLVNSRPQRPHPPAPLPPNIIHCTPPPSLISNVHFEGPIFENLAGHLHMADYLDKPISDQLIQFFQKHLYPALKRATTLKEVDCIEEFIDRSCPELNAFLDCFHLDLMPRLLYTQGRMTSLLYRTSVGRYLDFCPIKRILTPLPVVQSTNIDAIAAGFELLPVPCSQAAIHISPYMSLIEKQLLLRFIRYLSGLIIQSPPGALTAIPFSAILATGRLTPKLQALIRNAVLMDCAPQEISTLDAIGRILNFLFTEDVPYLIPYSGSSALVKVFAAYAEATGVSLHANSTMNSLVVDQTTRKVTSVNIIFGPEKTEPIQIGCNHLVTSYRFPGRQVVGAATTSSRFISRAIIGSDQTICDDGLIAIGTTTFLYLPVGSVAGNRVPVYVLERDNSSKGCPKRLYTQTLWCNAISASPISDLKPIIQALYTSNGFPPAHFTPLWSFYYRQTVETSATPSPPSFATNLYQISPPTNELHYEAVLREAEAIFKAMYPQEDFLPAVGQLEPLSLRV